MQPQDWKDSDCRRAGREGMPTHIVLRSGSVFDDSAWRIMVERVSKYRIFDDELSWGDYS